MSKTVFIAIVGRPNVGKSTLMNTILGEKVAIVSSKPQTTRNRIMGIHTVEDKQYVFLDTPGIFKPRNSIGTFMVNAANSTMQDADAVVLVLKTPRDNLCLTAIISNITALASVGAVFCRVGGLSPAVLLLRFLCFRRQQATALRQDAQSTKNSAVLFTFWKFYDIIILGGYLLDKLKFDRIGGMGNERRNCF